MGCSRHLYSRLLCVVSMHVNIKYRPNTVRGAVYYRILLTDLPVLLEDVPFHQRLHMWFMKPRRDTAISQREPDFRSTVDWTWVPSQVACTITCPHSSGFLAVGTPGDFGVFTADQWRWGGTARRAFLSGDASKTWNFSNSTQAYEKKTVKLGWHAWEPHTAICCTDNTTIPYLSNHWCLDICWLGIFAHLSEKVCNHRRNLGVERGRENAPLAFFYLRRVFLVLSWRGANTKNFRVSGGKECVYIKDWLKSIFPLSSWLIRKLMFLIPMVDFSLPLLLASLRLCL
jgi:hypothetical protein